MVTLVLGCAGAWAASTALLALVGLLLGNADWYRGLLAGSASSLIALLASLPVIVIAFVRFPTHAGLVTMTMGMLRMMVACALALIAVLVGGYPPLPVFICMSVSYFAILLSETLLLHERSRRAP